MNDTCMPPRTHVKKNIMNVEGGEGGGRPYISYAYYAYFMSCVCLRRHGQYNICSDYYECLLNTLR